MLGRKEDYFECGTVEVSCTRDSTCRVAASSSTVSIYRHIRRHNIEMIKISMQIFPRIYTIQSLLLQYRLSS
jgi:hypothetical protein